MKRFTFSLDKVLTYKEQVEYNLRTEHGQIMQRVAAEEAVLLNLEEEYALRCGRYDESKRRGCTIGELKLYEEYMENLLFRIQESEKALERLKQEEEKKRREVIRAKTETSSIDNLKQKRIKEYGASVRKEEENLIEEFVANASSGKARLAEGYPS